MKLMESKEVLIDRFGTLPGLLQFRFSRSSLAVVMKVSGEHGRSRPINLTDRQLHRELRAIGSHPGDLNRLADDMGFTGSKEPFQALAMRLTQRWGDDCLRQFLAKH